MGLLGIKGGGPTISDNGKDHNLALGNLISTIRTILSIRHANTKWIINRTASIVERKIKIKGSHLTQEDVQ